LYFRSDIPKQDAIKIKRFLEVNNLLNDDCHIYSLYDYDCFVHLCRLASGLISPVFGESAVGAQVKRAYQEALAQKKISKDLNICFQKVLHIAKDVRNEFGLNDVPSIVSRAILQEAEKIFPDLNSAKMLFVGDSKINHEIMGYVHKVKKNNNFLINRSAEKAKYAIEAFHMQFMDWDRIKEWGEFDIVVSAVSTSDYVITAPKDIHSVKTQLIVDLGVPHNVNPLLGKLPNMTLINMEALNMLCIPFFEKLFRLYSAADQFIISKLSGYIDRLELSRDLDSDNVDVEIYLSSSSSLKVKR
jgi:glutamyl-tRNA reductase